MQEKEQVGEEQENIDKAVWVPQGAEVVPAAAFLNGYAKADGKRFLSYDTSFIDTLLEKGLIDSSHHDVALHLSRLFKSGTSKQGFATMKIFSSTHGFDHSDYCPITVFLKCTRDLKHSQLYWIRVLCGVQTTTYENAARNVDIIKDALDRVEDRLAELRKHDDNTSREDVE